MDLEKKGSLKRLAGEIFDQIPCGVGSRRGDLHLTEEGLNHVLGKGAEWALREGYALEDDLAHIEERGKIAGADHKKVSERAKERGLHQLGTLGSGNHFVEVQYVDQIFDREMSETFGLKGDQIVVTIHTGSRGLGYQVCGDFIESAFVASKKYGIELPDRELASLPLESDEGRAYLGAMAAAANYAFCNRSVITHWVRQIFNQLYGVGVGQMPLLYDVCHNIAKFEEIPTKGQPLKVCLHRKGATRAYPGQPVLVPGDMGRYSFVLSGSKDSLQRTFGSACHGAGRELSRGQAKKLGKDRKLQSELEEKGIFVRSSGRNTLVEECSEAYKDVSEVVEATAGAGIASIVARLRPLVVVKG